MNTFRLLVIFNLYNGDTLMNIRYYSINLWDNNQLKIYQNIKASLSKNFISFVFSNCPQNLCILSSHEHYSSLVIFKPKVTLVESWGVRLLVPAIMLGNISNNVFSPRYDIFSYKESKLSLSSIVISF